MNISNKEKLLDYYYHLNVFDLPLRFEIIEHDKRYKSWSDEYVTTTMIIHDNELDSDFMYSYETSKWGDHENIEVSLVKQVEKTITTWEPVNE